MLDAPILYLTSFNESLYNASGKALINSFIKTKTDGHLLIGYEDFSLNLDAPISNISLFNLSNDLFLKTWLEDNKDVIPQHLGGDFRICNCIKPFGRKDSDHVKGCPFTWWNRNCSRWFRKLACLNYVLENYKDKFKYLVWLDADCVFKTQVRYSLFDNLFSKAPLLYLHGTLRFVDECGIVGYNLADPICQEFIRDFISQYSTKAYRNLVRWDDSYVFMKLRFKYQTKLKQFDLGGDVAQQRVADFCILRHYIQHYKGRHGRGLNLMK